MIIEWASAALILLVLVAMALSIWRIVQGPTGADRIVQEIVYNAPVPGGEQAEQVANAAENDFAALGKQRLAGDLVLKRTEEALGRLLASDPSVSVRRRAAHSPPTRCATAATSATTARRRWLPHSTSL